MDKTADQTLLPDFIKKPVLMWWVYILPQLILLLINLWSFWLVRDDIDPQNNYVAFSVFTAEVGLLLLAIFVWSYTTAQKKSIGLAWSGVFLAAHVGYLWYTSSHLWKLIPNAVEPWILDQGMLAFYQFTFIMPGLFYAGLRLACFDVKLKHFSNFGLSFLMAVAAPAAFYIVFIGLGQFMRPAGWRLPEFLAVLFFIGTTVTAFIGLVRLVVLTYNFIRSRGETVQIIFAVVIAIAGPIAGLLFNRTIPFPANFQTPWVYILAVVNGLIVLIPNARRADHQPYLLFARSVTFPFTFYFFLVFLPFLPLALPAMFAAGAGFLIFVPVVLFLLHTKRMHDDFRICRQAQGVLLSGLFMVLGCSVLPGYFTYQAMQDKTSLKEALKYVYSPNYAKDSSFRGSVKSVKRTLVNLRQFKDGIQLPYLSGFYNHLVFEGMVLPDSKIDYLHKLFTGEELVRDWQTQAWGFNDFMGGRRGREFNVTPIARDRNVELTSYDISTEHSRDVTRSRLHMTMKNLSASDTAEFFRELDVPSSVLITGFQLKVEDAMVPGQIFEKRAALWVYHMIRDFTRRDPGILTYFSPATVHFNVYPFLKDQTREAVIEFSFPTGLNPSVKLGDDHIALETGRSAENPIYLTQINNDTAALIVPENRLKDFPSNRKMAYFHFILDYSKASKGSESAYLHQMYDVLEQYGGTSLGFGKITAANFDVQELASGYIDWTNKLQVQAALDKISVGQKGSLNLERAIKHHLVQKPAPVDVNRQMLEPYPVFVVITHDQSKILDMQAMEFYQALMPYGNEYLVSTAAGHIEKKPLWPQPETGTAEEFLTVSFGGVVSHVPAVAGRPLVIHFNGDMNTAELKVLDPGKQQFEHVSAIKIMESKSEYTEGLRMQLENLDILHHPDIFEQKLPDIVAASKKSRVMAPSTSFIVVERSTQWKILGVKEKQRLSATNGLEFEEDFNTPAPSIFILMLLLFVWKKWCRFSQPPSKPSVQIYS